MKKILVADDHNIARQGIKTIIDDLPEFNVVAEAKTGDEAYLKVSNQDIDIALMDLSMPPGENGLVTIRRIAEDYPEVRIIVFSMHDEPEFINTALSNGALGYVLKSSIEDELITALKHAQNNEIYIDSAIYISKKDFNEIKDAKIKKLPQSYYDNLSKREREVLPLVCLGYSNQEIADKLFVTQKTVEAHKTHIMRKLQINSRRELIHYAISNHLVDF